MPGEPSAQATIQAQSESELGSTACTDGSTSGTISSLRYHLQKALGNSFCLDRSSLELIPSFKCPICQQMAALRC